jgi:hypothetical protein
MIRQMLASLTPLKKERGFTLGYHPFGRMMTFLTAGSRLPDSFSQRKSRIDQQSPCIID